MRKASSIKELKKQLIAGCVLDVSGCWLWTGSLRSNGYGQTWYAPRGKCTKVHRLAAYLWLGLPLDSKRLVCHRCDVRRCCNPEHLFIGSHRDNFDDAITKRTTCRNGHPRMEKNRLCRTRGSLKHRAGGWECKVCHREAAKRRLMARA